MEAIATHIVSVPWISQVTGEGSELRNDCGPACWSMLAALAGIKRTPAELAHMLRVEHRYTATAQAEICWQKLGLKTEWGSQIVDPPFLCLVQYLDLPERYDKRFDGLHWIVVTGTDRDEAGNITDVVYHDPLWPDETRGANKHISVSRFHEAEVSVAARARCWAG